MADDHKLREYLKRAIADAQDARRRLREVEYRQQEPLAIVGMACRFPGGVRSAEDLWRLVADGADAVSPFPADRGWSEDLFDPDPDRSGRSYVQDGGFLHDAYRFDAAFFGMSPREALATDPQQRLLLETAWQAFERARIDPLAMRGTRTGVFAGVMYNDYGSRLGPAPEGFEGYLVSGSLGSIASGRIAYALGLEGPAVSIDTACSSSLVAIHLAGRALRAGECDMALAGGVTVMSTPASFVEFSRQRGLAPDGRCKPFAAAADGTGWAEGVGLLVVETLSRAEANGHEILAVIRGSALNSDGASNGLTAPNGPAQRRVIREALTAAGLDVSDVDVVEAHGTGTTLGDPIEAQSLLATYGRRDPDRPPLWLGSLKSNIGHTQAAAGVGGVIKMVEAMRHGVLPRTLHVDAPTPHVEWSAGRVRLLEHAQPWPDLARPRRAAVSAFGISGTNAHMVIEQGPVREPGPAGSALPSVPWVVSARTPEALREQVERLAAVDATPEDIAYSLLTTRASHPHRIVVAGGDTAELQAALSGGLAGSAARGKVAFLFTGQGAQRAGMGSELHASYPAYAQAFDAVVAELDPLLEGSLAAAVDDPELIDTTGWAQPALFAFEVALCRLFENWGVVPDVVTGHSIGEIAAAHVAGSLSLPDAARLVAARARLMQALPEGGAMVAVNASEADVRTLLVDGVDIAAVNGSRSTVISGDQDAVLAIADRLADDGHRTRRLTVSHAFHSQLMDPMLDDFRVALVGLRHHPSAVPIVPMSSGELFATDAAEHWVRHVRDPVRLTDAIAALAGRGVTTFVEVGPDAVLTGLVSETADLEGWPAVRRDRSEAATVVAALGAIHAAGRAVDWELFFAGSGARHVDLPTYAFQRENFWLGPVVGEQALLGPAVEAADGSFAVFTCLLSPRSRTWLADHVIAGTTVLPGTAFLELAASAGNRTGYPAVAELTLESALVLPAADEVEVQVLVGGELGQQRTVEIYSRAAGGHDDPWTRHAAGLLAPTSGPPSTGLTGWPPEGAAEVDLAGVYERVAAAGYEYGPAFRCLRRAWFVGDDVFAEVALSSEASADAPAFVLHPVLLDAALHAVQPGVAGNDGPATVPFAWSGVEIHATGATELRVRLTAAGNDEFVVDAVDVAGAPVLTGRVTTRPLSDSARFATGRGLLRVGWKNSAPATRPATVSPVAATRIASADLRHVTPSPVAVFQPAAPDLPLPQAARAVVASVLGTVQAWLTDDRFADSTLVVATSAAISVGGEDVRNLAQAGVWGLVRSAATENPGRFVLVDTYDDLTDATLAAVLESGQTQVAVRGGELLVPRWEAMSEPGPPAAFGDTVLITGGTGALGLMLARHLVAEYGVPNLVLLSRRGSAVAGVSEAVARMAGLGAQVTVLACDASDRTALQMALASLETPPTAVVHTAGVLDDRLVVDSTAEQFERVLRPKIDAAWNLHELSGDLSAFVLYSSIAGQLGTAGQGGYAAGNTFLDALAHHRRAQGLPATAVAWGPWAGSGGMTGHLDEAAWRRLARDGHLALTEEHGLRLLDAALRTPEPVAIATRLDRAALIGQGATLSPVLRGLVRPAPRPAATAAAPSRQSLAAMGSADRQRMLTDLIRTHAAAVLGHPDGHSVEAGRAFKDHGFDSLTAVELRNRLAAATGLSLRATTVFDHPSPGALAVHLADELSGAPAATLAPPRASTGPTTEPIAIIGMACRYPGGVRSPSDLWRLVSDGVDAVGPFPVDRGWPLEELYDPDPTRTGSTYVREAGFLHQAAEFDPEFFGMSPREALATDPQQRLLLETAWEAFERAGVDPATVRGSRTGVFTGVMYNDYGSRPASAEFEGYLLTGSAGSIASGRVAYAFGLEGPAMTIDTACSSSLVALHLAVQALRSGECSLALAGGVTVMSTPGVFVEFARQRGLAPDGRCKPFAAAADGTGWAEGAGLLLVERLSDARRNGHPVLGVVRGSAVNSDGASNGLTAPNGPSQERVIRQALADAGIGPAEVDVVEAHGTGTRLGDPIEAEALIAVYGADRPVDRPLALGSLKSNLGHTQAAAGVGGVIKMVEAMRHGVLPRTLHVDEPTPHVDWSAGTVELLTAAREWSEAGRPRRAGVSSFGISGTNAHVVLEAPPDEAAAEPAGQLPAMPLVLSARSPLAVREQARLLLAGGDLSADVAYSLVTSRSALPHRAVVAGRTVEELRSALTGVAEGVPGRGVAHGPAVPSGRLAWLFTGQGAQRVGMGGELYSAHPAFAEAYDEVVAHLDPLLGGSLTAAIGDPQLLDQTGWTQPALFAYEVALARLFASWGITPDLVAGHSIGEFAASHVAGMLALPDAAALVAARARLMQALPEGGAMVSVRATEDEVAELLTEGIAVAAVNGPSTVVLSGEDDAVLAIAGVLAERGHETKRLAVSHAFHSPLMDPMLEEFRAVAAELTYTTGAIPVMSTLTGELIASVDAAYWVRHARETVRFGRAVQGLAKAGASTFLEIGPDAVLSTLAAGLVDGVVPAVRRDQPETTGVATALGALHGNGIAVDWARFFRGSRARRVDLPTYPFDRKRYWLDSHLSVDRRAHIPAPADGETSFADQLRGLPEPQRARHVRNLVLRHTAATLGHDLAAVTPDRHFQELGIDSMTAVELRDRLATATGTTLPATMVFDCPNPAAVADLLMAELVAPVGGDGALLPRLDELEAALTVVASDDRERPTIVRRLRTMLSRLADIDHDRTAAGDAVPANLESASADEVLAFIDNELGRSTT